MNRIRLAMREIPTILLMNIFASLVMFSTPYIIEWVFVESIFPRWAMILIQIFGGLTFFLSTAIIAVIVAAAYIDKNKLPN